MMTPAVETDNLSPIQKFYSGSNVFLTGGTGFLGRIVIEKLLRSCPEVSTIYILVRNKKGKNIHTRIDELFDDPVFERLKEECPKFRHKVIAVAGDCSIPELGLNMQDRQMIINQASIVFHVAATVRFDEKLKFAVSTNVKAIEEVVRLCKEMTNLKGAIHVSTAYSQCTTRVIEERFYPPPMDYKNLTSLIETIPEKLLDNITPAILEKWPNTYVFTKSIAEDMVRQETQELPFGIFRPAIITSTYQEPIKGWVNNLYGPTGIVAGAFVGLIRACNVNGVLRSNIVPVDMCANALIVSCYDVAKKFEESKRNGGKYEIEVYNYESNTDNPITWDRLMELNELYGINYPTVRTIWYYSFTMFANPLLAKIAMFFLHFLPAIVVDGALMCVGKSPRLLAVYKRVQNLSNTLSYFTRKEWQYNSDKIKNIYSDMTREDKEIFFCDFRELDWNDYFKEYIKGIRVYMVKDPLETLDAARSRFRRLYWLHQGTKLLVVFLLLRLLWTLYTNL